MTMLRNARALIIALAIALAVQVPMFPGTGLETRDLSGFTSWYQTISMVVFPALLVAAVAAIILARNHWKLAAWTAIVFAVGMVPITLLDLTGLGGASPPTSVAALEAAALATFGATLTVASRTLRGQSAEPLRHPAARPPAPV